MTEPHSNIPETPAQSPTGVPADSGQAAQPAKTNLPTQQYAAPQQNYTAPQTNTNTQPGGYQPQPGAAAQPSYQQQSYYQQPGYQQPGYQQPGYQQPGYPVAAPYGAAPYPAAPAAKTNSLALTSLITGVCAFPLYFFWIGALLSIVSLVTGHIALSQIKRTGENGRGLALAGVITSWVLLGISVLFFVLFMILFVFFESDYRYNF